MIDLSLLKNIDFTKPENVLFLFIICTITFIVCFIVVVIISKIIKSIKRAVVGFNVKRPNSVGKPAQEQSFFVKTEDSAQPGAALHRAAEGVSFMGGLKKKDEKEKKGAIEIEKEKKEKGIEGGLKALKSDTHGSGGLQSRMPSRTQDETKREEIKIPTSKSFSNAAENLPEEMKIPRPEHFSVASQQVPRNNPEAVDSRAGVSANVQHSSKEISGSNNSKKSDSSGLFEGGREVPRKNLEHEMRTNPKIWQAARESMLNLSPVERSKLVKEVFSSAYGGNISKSDLKLGIKKLDSKMRVAKTSTEHEKLRKEIKFFKKIGKIN